MNAITKHMPVALRFDAVTRHEETTMQRASDWRVHDIQPGTYELRYDRAGSIAFVTVKTVVVEQFFEEVLLTQRGGKVQRDLSIDAALTTYRYGYELDPEKKGFQSNWLGGELVFAEQD